MIKIFLTSGLNNIRDLHATSVDKGWLGTSGTAVAESQTGLQAGIAGTKIAITRTYADKTNVFEYTCPSTTSAGSTFREFAIIDDGTVEYNRVVFTGVAHTANDDVIVRQTFYYDNP